MKSDRAVVIGLYYWKEGKLLNENISMEEAAEHRLLHVRINTFKWGADVFAQDYHPGARLCATLLLVVVRTQVLLR